ncbi:hypothetical protein [Gaopeijia maritima]|uniref:Lipoprotein n=1 Tax=Gaopeijia maritima TaxID=3119007 RepID=A0ABU9E6T0_9BACT
MKRFLTVVALLTGLAIAPGCGLLEPECKQVPGRPLEAGTYTLSELPSSEWEQPFADLLPGPSAENVTLTLSEDREWVTIRYEVDGSVIEDRWQVVGSFH